MEEGKIHLKARAFNEWMDNMRGEITGIKDGLVLLETEERQLSEIWESGAKEKWEQELQKELVQVRACVNQMEILAGKTEEKARVLARMENNMLQAAEKL